MGITRDCYILYGEPFTGVSTFSTVLETELNIKSLELRDMLRSEIEIGSQLGIEIKSEIDKGLVLNQQIISNLLKKNLIQEKNNILLINYPRKKEQYPALLELLQQLNFSLKHIWYIRNINIEYLAKLHYQENQLMHDKYENTPESIKNNIIDNSSLIRSVTDYLTTITSVTYIDIDFESMKWNKHEMERFIREWKNEKLL
jgi:adenylate kinase